MNLDFKSIINIHKKITDNVKWTEILMVDNLVIMEDGSQQILKAAIIKSLKH